MGNRQRGFLQRGFRQRFQIRSWEGGNSAFQSNRVSGGRPTIGVKFCVDVFGLVNVGPLKNADLRRATPKKPLRGGSRENYDSRNESRLFFFISYLSIDVSTAPMVHYTCDRCQRSIDLNEGPRYVVRIDVEVIADVTDDASDEESIDFLAELNETLAYESACMTPSIDASEPLDDLHDALCRGEDLDHLDSSFSPTIHHDGYDSENTSLPPSFDLCSQCYAEYTKNPLSRERALKLHFSNN